MTIQLCNCSNDPRVINKSYTVIEVVTADPFGEMTITDPVLRLRRKGNELQGINYIYIPDWIRYYFVTNIKLLSGGIMEISCHIDVLNSFKNAILASNAICVRSERTDVGPRLSNTREGTFINDTQRPVLPEAIQTYYEYDTTVFNLDTASSGSRNFVLNVAGGSGE